MGNIQKFTELTVAFALAILSMPLTVLIVILIRLTSKGPILHWSQRIGVDNKIFLMPKFRTMMISTPQVATHLLQDPSLYYTSIGKFLRKYSLDEIPQLFSIIKGDMKFVGPRPALFNQVDLIKLRTELGIHKLTPGLTGWAQVNGRDDISIKLKVELDHQYLMQRSFKFDLNILFLTFIKVLKKEGISH